MRRCPGPRRGFTLTELLTVMLIIAVLLAILLPVMRRVAYRSTTLRCLNDKKQLIMGTLACAKDRGGNFINSSSAAGTLPFNSPGELSASIVRTLNTQYAVPLGCWMCAVDVPSMDQRNATMKTLVENNWAQDLIASGANASTGSCFIVRWNGTNTANELYNRLVAGDPGVVKLNLPGNDPALGVYSDKLYIIDAAGTFEGSHKYRDTIESSIAAYLDGHVEAKPVSKINDRSYVYPAGGPGNYPVYCY